MRKFYHYIIKLRIPIMAAFLVMAAFSFIAKSQVKIDYDMNDYLPEDSASTIALDTMESEFSGGIPNARVLVKDVSINEALEYKEKLEEVDGVDAVTWLDDYVEIYIPLEMYDSDTVESYYKDGNALFTLTIDENKREQTVDDVRAIIGDDNAMTGSAVSTAVATQTTIKEIKYIAAFAVLVVFLILLYTTTSWIEPLIVLIGLGVAIILNDGSNLMFGTISFVTNAAGSILQLAVSLDYSIFLIHRFEECRLVESDPKKAMENALVSSTSSILSSGMTTVIGFLALILMQFQIGPDMGLALAKGVSISLITVFSFMPGLILLFYKLLEKTTHKSFLPSFNKLGRATLKFMIPAACIFAVLIVPSFIASTKNSYYYGSSHIFAPGTQYGDDTTEIQDIFGKKDTYVLMVPKGDEATERVLANALEEIDNVTGVTSTTTLMGSAFPTDMLPGGLTGELESENYRRLVISVDADFEGDETFNLVKEIRNTAQDYYPDTWLLAGEGVSTLDLMDTITSDMIKVNIVAIAAVFIVLVITLRNILLPLLLVATIETAIWLNFSIPFVMGQTIFYIAYLIISSIQLGATVDYAILMTERYKENRQTLEKKEAVTTTISNVAGSILTSGSVMTIVGFLLGFISSHGVLAQLGRFLGSGTLLSMLLVFMVLPGLLYTFDRFLIKKSKVPKKD